RLMLLGGAVLALVVADVHGQKVYKTPQDVFKAAQAAAKKNDLKTFYRLLTPESAERMASQMAMLGVMFKGFSQLDEKIAKQMKPIFEAMDKHGLTDEKLKKMKKIDPKADPKEQAKAMKQLVEPIKDKGAFFADMMAALKKVNPKGGGLEELADATLE